MFAEGRPTRSKRKLAEVEENFEPRRTRQRVGGQLYQPYLGLDNNTGSSSSSSTRHGSFGSIDPPMASDPFEQEDIPNCGFHMLMNDNDPNMYSNPVDDDDDLDNCEASKGLHTPPGSVKSIHPSEIPTPILQPQTPAPRPLTPGGGLNYIDEDNTLDTTFETSSLVVEAGSLSNFGPPPTPMCPSLRVGPISSSSLFAHLPNSPSTSTSTSIALPLNILGSDDEDNDEADVIVINTLSPESSPEESNEIVETCISINSESSKYSPDITDTDPDKDPTSNSICIDSVGSSQINSNNKNNTTNNNSTSKHHDRLKIRAPSSPSCQLRGSQITQSKSQPPLESPSQNKRDAQSQIGNLNQPSPPSKNSELSASALSRNTNQNDLQSSPFKKPLARPRIKFNFLVLERNYKSNYSPHNNRNSNSNSETVPTSTSSSFSTVNPNIDQVIEGRQVALSFKEFISAKKNLPPTSNPQFESLPTSMAIAKKCSPPSDNSALSSPHPQQRTKPVVRDGNILSIKLTNFLTHKAYYQEWNPNVNFITGQNGSGKSAILQSLQIVFGDKAANTQRTSSVKGLIRKGCASAEIEVKFTNYNGSINKAKYGDVVTLSRRMKFNGGASVYHIENQWGDKMKINQHELVRIAYALQIDPNNPVQFLQQDKTSERVKAGSGKHRNQDKERFKKFKDSTQLSSKEHMIQESKENLEVAKALIQTREETWKVYVWQMKQLKEQLDQISKLERSENAKMDLINEYNWSNVRVAEIDMEDIKAKKEDTYAKIKRLKEDKRGIEDQIMEIQSKSENNQMLAKRTKHELVILARQREDKLNELRDKKKSITQMQLEYNGLLDRIERSKKEIEDEEADMNVATVDYTEQNKKHEMEIERLETELQAKEIILNESLLRKTAVTDEIAEFQSRLALGDASIKKLKSKLAEAKKASSKAYKFDLLMQEFTKRIERCKDWKIRPVGPLGAHILHVKESKYAPLIERILWNSLFSFVVQTKEDFIKINDLKNQTYKGKAGGIQDPQIMYVPGVNVKDYMAKLRGIKERLKNYRTVLSMLHVKNPVAEMGLIEKTSCERMVLYENKDASHVALSDTSKVPDEVSHAFTLDWYRVNLHPYYQYQPVRKKRGTEIIPMTKVDDSLEMQLMADINAEYDVLRTCKQSMSGHNDGPEFVPGLQQLLNKHIIESEIQQKEVNQIRHKIRCLKSLIEKTSDKAVKEKDLANDRKMVSDAKAKLEKDIKTKDEIKAKMEAIKVEMRQMSEEKSDIDRRVMELQNQITEMEKESQEVRKNIAKLEKEMDGYRIQIARHDLEFEKLEKVETKVTDDLTLKTKEANACGDRPKVLKRGPDIIQRELENLKLFLEKNKDKLLSKRRILQEYQHSRSLVEQITKEIKCIKLLCARMEPYIKVGEDCYEKMKKNLGSMLASIFSRLVEARGQTGALLVDWETETIVFSVSPDKEAEARARKNYTRKDGETVIANRQGIIDYYNNLSGGERSKALVFFIMAMWELTDLPFHCLDEFESCLDIQERGGLHSMLIKHAKNHPDAQFFIMTPLRLNDIPRNDKFISIFTLKPPRRLKQKQNDDEQADTVQDFITFLSSQEQQ